jgi:hypothetical protein
MDTVSDENRKRKPHLEKDEECHKKAKTFENKEDDIRIVVTACSNPQCILTSQRLGMLCFVVKMTAFPVQKWNLVSSFSYYHNITRFPECIKKTDAGQKTFDVLTQNSCSQCLYPHNGGLGSEMHYRLKTFRGTAKIREMVTMCGDMSVQWDANPWLGCVSFGGTSPPSKIPFCPKINRMSVTEDLETQSAGAISLKTGDLPLTYDQMAGHVSHLGGDVTIGSRLEPSQEENVMKMLVMDNISVYDRTNRGHMTCVLPSPPGLTRTLVDFSPSDELFEDSMYVQAPRPAGGILMDDARMGKTLQWIAKKVTRVSSHGIRKPSLVVTLPHLVGHWRDECLKHAPGLSVAVKNQGDPWNKYGHDVTITTYDSVVSDFKSPEEHNRQFAFRDSCCRCGQKTWVHKCSAPQCEGKCFRGVCAECGNTHSDHTWGNFSYKAAPACASCNDGGMDPYSRLFEEVVFDEFPRVVPQWFQKHSTQSRRKRADPRWEALYNLVWPGEIWASGKSYHPPIVWFVSDGLVKDWKHLGAVWEIFKIPRVCSVWDHYVSNNKNTWGSTKILGILKILVVRNAKHHLDGGKRTGDAVRIDKKALDVHQWALGVAQRNSSKISRNSAAFNKTMGVLLTTSSANNCDETLHQGLQFLSKIDSQTVFGNIELQQVKSSGRQHHTECPICIEPFDVCVQVRPCKHEFCSDCLMTAMNGKMFGTCPLCRQYFTSRQLGYVPPPLGDQGNAVIPQFPTLSNNRKIDRVVQMLKRQTLQGEEEANKTVVYTSSEGVTAQLKDALSTNFPSLGIYTGRSKASMETTLEKFSKSATQSILVFKLGLVPFVPDMSFVDKVVFVELVSDLGLLEKAVRLTQRLAKPSPHVHIVMSAGTVEEHIVSVWDALVKGGSWRGGDAFSQTFHNNIKDCGFNWSK